MDNKKQGFTLVELLGILVLISIIGIIVFVAIDKALKSGQENAYNKQIKMIELATENWGSENLEQLPSKGKSTIVTFMVLKMYGYLDVNVSDPNTGLCFPNDAFVKVTNNGDTGKITYEVDKNSLSNGQLSCDSYNKDYLEQPLVTISGGISSLGNNQTTKVKVISNYKIEDTGKIHLKEEIITSEHKTATTASIGDSKYNEEKNVWEIEVTITSGKSDKAEVWIEVDEKAIELADGRYSSAVKGNSIMIINNLDLSDATFINDEVGSYSGDITNGFICADPKNTEVTTWAGILGDDRIDRSYNLPKEYLGSSHANAYLIYDGVQYIKVYIPRIYDNAYSDIYDLYYYTYVDFKDDNNNLKKMYRTKEEKWVISDTLNEDTNLFYSKFTNSPITYSELKTKFDSSIYTAHEIRIPVLINGTYHIGLCDTNGNCEELTTSMSKNDCKEPTLVSSTPSDNTKIFNLFIDEPSEATNYSNNTNQIPIQSSSYINIIGAIILPPGGSIIEQMLLYGRSSIRGYSLANLNSHYGNALSVYANSVGTNTLKELRDKANSELPYCNNVLHIIAEDGAGNVNYYSENLENNSSKCDIGGDGGNSICDLECQILKDNYEFNTAECKNNAVDCQYDIYQQNKALCDMLGYWSSDGVNGGSGCTYVPNDEPSYNNYGLFCVSGSEYGGQTCTYFE